ncbi:IGR protein motif-domain-containing protein [Cristinia sonorae]|uniref:Small ribosomal subunit protein mS41 n=1 Tax=Cristinia sonorae TaxID=1940300 RepID=A0A8K0XT17_9AGAR|nr:IGR protein motif-domain-containing protein [Cristinia sonorae]
MASLFGLRLANLVPRHCRTLVNHAASRPIPPPRGTIDSPVAFLKAIGRSAETKLPAVPESWEELWKLNGQVLKKAGVAVKDRRYIMWSMEKYRMGEDPAEFAHPPRPKRTIRGRGPSVQNGKRIRSRRL